MKQFNFADKNLFIAVLFLLSYAYSNLVFAGDAPNYEFSGYFKTFNNLIQSPSFDGAQSPLRDAEFVSANTLRMEFKWKPTKVNSFHAAYALLPVIGTATTDALSDIMPRPDPFNYRLADIRTRLYPAPGNTSEYFALSNNIDRFVLDYYSSAGDFIIGRQPIAFGSSRFISPTDILTPFTFEALDKEERVGIDAIRYRLAVGSMGEFDAAWVFGEDAKFSNSAAFTKIKIYAWNTDITAISTIFRNNLMLGFDFARTVGGASVWVEGAYIFASLLSGYKSDENYFRLSLGADYNFAESLYAYIEYHFNGAGKINSADYSNVLNTTAYTEGAVYLFGMHYLSVGSSYEVTPLWHLNTNFILNANDPSVFLIFMLEYNVAQNIYIDLGTYITIGRISELTGNDVDPLIVASEFGLYSNLYYIAGRFYF